MGTSNPWTTAYRAFGDAAAAAFEKAFCRYLEGKQDNPKNWSWSLICYASKQAETDLHRKNNAEKRGGNRVCSLDRPIPGTDTLTWDQTAENGQQVGASSSVILNDPAKVVAARKKAEEMKAEPLKLVQLGYMNQEKAAQVLGVSQATVSRRLKALEN